MRTVDQDIFIPLMKDWCSEHQLNVKIYFHAGNEPTDLAEELEWMLLEAGFSLNHAPMVQKFSFRKNIDRLSGITIADEPEVPAKALAAIMQQVGLAVELRHLAERVDQDRMVGTSEVLVEIWPERAAI